MKKTMKGKKVGHAPESDYESGSDDSQSDCASDFDSGSGSDPETEPELKTFLFDFKYQLKARNGKAVSLLWNRSEKVQKTLFML